MNLGPSNYPFNETYATLIPAILMGNSIVMKVPNTGGLAHFLTMEVGSQRVKSAKHMDRQSRTVPFTWVKSLAVKESHRYSKPGKHKRIKMWQKPLLQPVFESASQCLFFSLSLSLIGALYRYGMFLERTWIRKGKERVKQSNDPTRHTDHCLANTTVIQHEAYAECFPPGVVNFISGRGRDTMPFLRWSKNQLTGGMCPLEWRFYGNHLYSFVKGLLQHRFRRSRWQLYWLLGILASKLDTSSVVSCDFLSHVLGVWCAAVKLQGIQSICCHMMP